MRQYLQLFTELCSMMHISLNFLFWIRVGHSCLSLVLNEIIFLLLHVLAHGTLWQTNRALSTLEGIARTLDPSFNVLQVMYPTALNRMMQNPSNSPVVDETLQNLIRSKETGRIDRGKISKLLRDSALISGYSRRKVLLDVLRTRGGRRLIRDGLKEEFRHLVRRKGMAKTLRRREGQMAGRKAERRSRRRRVSNYFRL